MSYDKKLNELNSGLLSMQKEVRKITSQNKKLQEQLTILIRSANASPENKERPLSQHSSSTHLSKTPKRMKGFSFATLDLEKAFNRYNEQ